MPLAHKARWTAAAGAAAIMASMLTGTPLASADVPDDTKFYVPEPNPDAVQQVAESTEQGNTADAALIQEILETPTAIWVESGTPKAAEKEVRKIMKDAAAGKAKGDPKGKGKAKGKGHREATLPTLVIYNIPFRDCAQYSSGGATTVAEYKAWIDGVARGIGDSPALIALEPDGLGIIPHYTTIEGTKEWCQPAEADADTAAAERFEMLNYAVDAFKALPGTKVYLDGTHTGWLNVGDISDRLIKAGVERADGFFLNASNYQYTQNLTHYGTWISSCLAYVEANPGKFADCGNQYWSGGPANGWNGVALDTAKIWSDTASDPTANTSGINSRYAALLGSIKPEKTFIIDTSRNGQGPWIPTAEQAAAFPDEQTWCNPPERGVGPRPTAATGHPLVDAYVWIKVPGESDGQCSRGLGAGDNVVDPIWGQVDPDAGVWFPEQALELARLAVPPLS